jgi:hypothetical protein
MKTRALLAAPVLVFALALTACTSGSGDSAGAGDRPTTPQEHSFGNVRAGNGQTPDLPDGWLESMHEYADCLNENGAQGVKVDETQGGLELGTVLSPDAVSNCLKCNPVHKEGGAKEMNPDAG